MHQVSGESPLESCERLVELVSANIPALLPVDLTASSYNADNRFHLYLPFLHFILTELEARAERLAQMAVQERAGKEAINAGPTAEAN